MNQIIRELKALKIVNKGMLLKNKFMIYNFKRKKRKKMKIEKLKNWPKLKQERKNR